MSASTLDTILATRGAGSISSNLVLQRLRPSGPTVVNLDLLTHAGNQANAASLAVKSGCGKYRLSILHDPYLSAKGEKP